MALVLEADWALTASDFDNYPYPGSDQNDHVDDDASDEHEHHWAPEDSPEMNPDSPEMNPPYNSDNEMLHEDTDEDVVDGSASDFDNYPYPGSDQNDHDDDDASDEHEHHWDEMNPDSPDSHLVTNTNTIGMK